MSVSFQGTDSTQIWRRFKGSGHEEKQVKAVAEPADEILTLVKDGALSVGGLLTTKEQQKLFDQKHQAMTFSFFSFFPLLFRLKNPAFHEEKEWRLISVFLRKAGDEGFGEMPKMEFRATSDRFIPERRIKLSKFEVPPIEEIVLGPQNITPLDTVKGMLHRYGMGTVEVRRSASTFRTPIGGMPI